MMVSRQRNGLNGQHILAQGNALGLMENKKIVRVMMFFDELSLFRTKDDELSCLHGNSETQFRLKEFFLPDYHVPADGFYRIFLTQGVALG